MGDEVVGKGKIVKVIIIIHSMVGMHEDFFISQVGGVSMRTLNIKTVDTVEVKSGLSDFSLIDLSSTMLVQGHCWESKRRKRGRRRRVVESWHCDRSCHWKGRAI